MWVSLGQRVFGMPLDFGQGCEHGLRMGFPDQPVTLSPEQVAELLKRLADARHSINNNLALIVAASELLRRKPETAMRVAAALADPPDRIVQEIREFAAALEQALMIRRD